MPSTDAATRDARVDINDNRTKLVYKKGIKHDDRGSNGVLSSIIFVLSTHAYTWMEHTVTVVRGDEEGDERGEARGDKRERERERVGGV